MTKLAIVMCTHHKPWLAMATLITLALQDFHQFDVHIIYIVGDGECPERVSYAPYRAFVDSGARQQLDPAAERLSYEGYDRAARDLGLNPKLSPFDARLRDICRVGGVPLREMDVQNDHALDSGAWYRFIRSGAWRAYDYVFCVQEGTLFTRPRTLAAVLRFAVERNVGFLAGGHFKDRMPKGLFLNHYNTRDIDVRPVDRFHDAMMREVFGRFCVDPTFRSLVDGWPDDGVTIRQHHLPDLWKSQVYWRVRNVAEARAALPRYPVKRWLAAWLREHRDLFPRFDLRRAQWRVGAANLLRTSPNGQTNQSDDCIYVQAERRPVGQVVSYVDVDGVRFHREEGVEWHGSHCDHLFSRTFLERLSAKLDQHGLYSVLDLPFAGTALEVVWGFFPHWLGFDKWFFDGIHRVAKNLVTYRREDESMMMASYINRYYPGLVAVAWSDDHLRIVAAHRAVRKRLLGMLTSDRFWTRV